MKIFKNKVSMLWKRIVFLLVICSLITIAFLFITKGGDVGYEEIGIKILEAIGIVFLIEFASHIFFETKKHTELKFLLNEQLTAQTKEIKIEMQNNRTGIENINKAGIGDVVSFSDFKNFLIEVLAYIDKNKDEDIVVRILVIYLKEFTNSPENLDSVSNFTEIKKLIKQILNKSENKIEIILPNFKDPKVISFLDLRTNSDNNHSRVEACKNTYEIFHKLIGKEFPNFQIFLHSSFSGFSILSYSNIIYQLNYLNIKADTRQLHFIKLFINNDDDNLGNQILKHYNVICEQSISSKEFDLIKIRQLFNIGELINSLVTNDSYRVNGQKENFQIEFFEKNSYSFFTHAEYRITNLNNKLSREHYLSKSILFIKEKIKNSENCFNVNLSTEIKKDGEVEKNNKNYDGKLTFNKISGHILIVLVEKGTNEYPFYISGRIPSGHTKEFITLHYTFISSISERQTTNIGILELKPINDLQEPMLFPLEPDKNNESVNANSDSTKLLLIQIKDYLMRNSKVSIKTPKVEGGGVFSELSTTKDIKNYFLKRFLPLENHDKVYVMFYPKSNLPNPERLEDFGRADLSIHKNGIAVLKLQEIDEKVIDENEIINKTTYYGDMNLQQTSSENPIVSIKFVNSKFSKNSLGDTVSTNNRELFIMLFWDNINQEDDAPFELTRGIMMSDRDTNLGGGVKRKQSLPIIESNQLVIIDKEKFNEIPNEDDKINLIKYCLRLEEKFQISNPDINFTLTLEKRNFLTIQFNEQMYLINSVLKDVNKTINLI